MHLFLYEIPLSEALTNLSRVEDELARLAGHDVAGAGEQVHCPRVRIVVVDVYEADLKENSIVISVLLQGIPVSLTRSGLSGYFLRSTSLGRAIM